MSTPEDFCNQLQQSFGKKEQKRLARIRKKEMREQRKEEYAQKQECWRNQEVLKVESEIPARQYIDELRNLMNSSEETIRFGPSHGAIAYVFIYDKKTVFSEPSIFSGMDRNFRPTSLYDDYYKYIGVILTYKKRITIAHRSNRIEHNDPSYVDKLNPLRGYPQYYWDNHGDFRGDSKRDFKRFTKVLANFYSNEPTGINLEGLP